MKARGNTNDPACYTAPRVSLSRWRWRNAVVLAAAAEGLATALWLIPASAHITSWPAGGPPSRIALVPSFGLLALLAATALVASAAIARWAWRRQTSGSLERVAGIATPALLLWLWVVPFLPWLADRLPLLLVLSGPIRWAIACVVLVWVLDRAAGRAVSAALAAVRLPEGRVLRRTVFVASLSCYLALGLYWVNTVGIDGDEPHYLIIAESLLRDGDLQIENNHQRGDYLKFYANPLRPHYQARGRNGAIYSLHAPGLPVLVLPAYAAAGHRGAVLFIGVLAALAALAVFDLASALAGRGAGLVTWAAVCFTVPFLPYAWSIFPEMPAALVTAWAASWLFSGGGATARVWLWRGLALGILPWLHIKFSILAACLIVAFVAWLRRDRRAIAALLVPFALSGVLWLVSYYAIYGTFDPSVTFSGEMLAVRNIPHGVLGLLFDQKFGLLPYSPIYLLAIPGFLLLVRDRSTRASGVALAVTVLVFVASSTRLYIFWGGLSAPARFLVPLLPLAAPMIAVAAAKTRTVAVRALAPVWLGISLTIAFVAVVRPYAGLLFSDAHGVAVMLQTLQGGSPLPFVAPTLTEPDWASHLPVLGLWLLAAAAGFGAAVLVSRVARPMATPGRIAVAAGLTFLVAASLATASPDPEARRATVEHGALETLRRFDGARSTAIGFSPLQRMTESGVQQAAAVPLRAAAPVNGTVSTAAVDLPPGVYTAQAWFATRDPHGGELRVATRRAVFGAAAVNANPAVVPFHVPAEARGVVVQLTGVSARLERLVIQAQSVVPPDAREPWPVRAIENAGGTAGGYLVYTDPYAYLENGSFWSRGTSATKVYVAPGSGSEVIVTLSNGPSAGEVEITLAGRRQVIALGAYDTREIVIPVTPDQTFVPIRVRSATRFRPMQAGLSKDDDRDLGCRVQVVVR
jgi:hypothetical protein